MDIKPSNKFPGPSSSIGSHHSFDRFVEKLQDKPQTKVAERAAAYEPFNTERRPIDDIEPELVEKIRKDFEVDAHGGPTTYLGGMAGDLIDDPSDDANVLNGVQAAIEIIKANLFPLIQTSGDFLGNEILANELLGRIIVEDLPRFAHKRKDMVQDIDGPLAREFMVISERMHVLALAARDKNILSFLRNESALTMQDPTDRIVDHTTNGAKQLKVKESPRFSANYRTLSRAARDPREEQKLIRKQLGAVLSGEYDALFVHTPTSASEATVDDHDHINTLPPLLSSEMQELQFEILPGDTNLRELSERVYDESSDAEKVRVDLGRIQVLEEMRTLFGEDHCYFARGEAGGNCYTDENGESINEDFIILVMQHHDETGQVAREDALAISPIARRHAVFYMRQDASEGLSWREVYRLTKKHAQDLGVRKLKFVAPEGIDVYTSMKEKLFTLATCRTEDFHSDLRYDAKTGTYVPKTQKIRAGMMQSIQIAA